MARPGVAVDAAMLAAAIGVDRAVEADIRRVVVRDDGARALDGDLRLERALEEVDTPALVVELDAFERNLRTLADSVKARKVRVRPHAKTHKCPEIAKRQLAHGAVGVCCQKVAEAEALVDGGIQDVLVSNEVVGAPGGDRGRGAARL